MSTDRNPDAEVAALAGDLRILAKELWPHRETNIPHLTFSDELLLLGIRLERLLANKIDKLPPRLAHDLDPERNVGSHDFIDSLE